VVQPSRMKLLLCACLMAFSALSAADLKLRDGRIYRNTKVLRAVGDDAEVFIAGFGLQKIPLSQLMPEDQANLNAQTKAQAELDAKDARQREANRAANEAELKARLAGVKTYTLKTTKGKTIDNIYSWEPELNGAGIKVTHAGGLAHLLLSDLDDASQKLVKQTKFK